MIEKNFQCMCGLCFSTWYDWANHRQATSHEQHRIVTVEQLSREAKKAIEGLKTFKHNSEVN